MKDWSNIHEQIQEIYEKHQEPWVIGYSGGKDSTSCLQLVWEAISKLPEEKRNKKIYVISSDTLVETPVIVDFINETLSRVNEAAKKQNMPFEAQKVKPIIDESFWVNLIGRGYPAPSNTFRWCTHRLKIQPSNRFISDTIAKHGSVILVLGLRTSESSSRAGRMKKHNKNDTLLTDHSKFTGAKVYPVIKDWTIDDVWDYLLMNNSPWGNDNRELVQLYRKATGECPLVVDETTPPCGNSRFGCWVCTLVVKEKSITSLIDSGEKWMEPLLELRSLLVSTQDPAVKHKYREYKRRKGYVSFKTDGSGKISRGPYKFDFCKEILTKVLKTQKKVRKNGPDPKIQLILPDELRLIRKIWRMERGDWYDTVPKIYNEVTGEEFEWVIDDVGGFTGRDSELLEVVCSKNEIPSRLVSKLMDAELQTQGMRRRSSIYKKIDQIFNEEWRSEEEIIQAYQKAKNSNGKVRFV